MKITEIKKINEECKEVVDKKNSAISENVKKWIKDRPGLGMIERGRKYWLDLTWFLINQKKKTGLV